MTALMWCMRALFQKSEDLSRFGRDASRDAHFGVSLALWLVLHCQRCPGGVHASMTSPASTRDSSTDLSARAPLFHHIDCDWRATRAGRNPHAAIAPQTKHGSTRQSGRNKIRVAVTQKAAVYAGRGRLQQTGDTRDCKPKSGEGDAVQAAAMRSTIESCRHCR